MIIVVEGQKHNGKIQFNRLNTILNSRVKYSIAVKCISLQLSANSDDLLDNELLVLTSNIIDTSSFNISNGLLYFPFNANNIWQFFKPACVSYFNIIIRDLNYAYFAVERYCTRTKIDFERILVELELKTLNDGFQ